MPGMAIVVSFSILLIGTRCVSADRAFAMMGRSQPKEVFPHVEADVCLVDFWDYYAEASQVVFMRKSDGSQIEGDDVHDMRQCAFNSISASNELWAQIPDSPSSADMEPLLDLAVSNGYNQKDAMTLLKNRMRGFFSWSNWECRSGVSSATVKDKLLEAIQACKEEYRKVNSQVESYFNWTAAAERSFNALMDVGQVEAPVAEGEWPVANWQQAARAAQDYLEKLIELWRWEEHMLSHAPFGKKKKESPRLGGLRLGWLSCGNDPECIVTNMITRSTTMLDRMLEYEFKAPKSTEARIQKVKRLITSLHVDSKSNLGIVKNSRAL